MRYSCYADVYIWKMQNPQGKKIDCARALNLSYPTICKHWGNTEEPSCKDKIRAWRKEHPEGTKTQCMRETKISWVTVGRHWN